ncbi:stress response protein YsnF [Pontibacter aydingkolensis]|uniref:YsnF/AvaK domain-containing protein n=1 Tax=Pontibacter aydingkolensis TaxID=1911536 RepID=A0ABS7CXP3_9BACT|nr:YsnF/AvaK domain-containing protein [Pontibacter aydingkolensis]MBW7468629.1 YsnF/AvaK domain-containing protein [Pontibacter aydingkolensis]
MKQTVIGIFDYGVDAQMAAQELERNGIPSNNIDIAVRGAKDKTNAPNQNRPNPSNPNMGGPTNTTATTGTTDNKRDNDFFNSLFDSRDESSKYYKVAKQGSIVTVHANSKEQATKAAELLDKCGAIDVNERSAQYRSMSSSDKGKWTNSNQSIPVVEEKMQVGKREVETGGVTLKSRIIERPVEEKLRLREEHVHVERRPVNRPANEKDMAGFKEGEITMTEHAEKPIVNKQARVVEEVRLGKEVEQREETVRGTERKTDVEVDKLNPRSDKDRLDPRNENRGPDRR